jgi:hypothetical protein
MKVEASAVERIVKIGKAAPTDIRQMIPAREYSRFPGLAARPTRGDGPTRGAGSYSYFYGRAHVSPWHFAANPECPLLCRL